VSQTNYANLGRLMIVVGVCGLLPLLMLPALRRSERDGAARQPAEPPGVAPLPARMPPTS
jgi:hypothetical protein